MALVDPYNALPVRWPMRERPIMDINQRFMYPALARSGRFDSAVIGTSTSRLFDPENLDRAFDARFANLAMNAATAWEQSRMLDLFLRRVPKPKRLIIGIDNVWCDARADAERITFRGFPEWMYGENPWAGYLYMLNPITVEIAGRLVANRLGLRRERIRNDGYEVFTPPDEVWTLERARFHLWGGREPRAPAPQVPPVVLAPAEAATERMPALPWLDEALARAAIGDRAIIAFMPHHVSVQPQLGSRGWARLDLCKGRVAAIAARHGAIVLDFMIPGSVTTDDTLYWDPLHYKVSVARRLEGWLADAAAGRMPLPTSLARSRRAREGRAAILRRVAAQALQRAVRSPSLLANKEVVAVRLILKLKLFVLIALWSAICLGLYAVLALGEAVLEIGAGVAGAPVGQGGALVNLVDITGDIVQWGVGLLWVVGLVALWYVKRLFTSREERARAGRVAMSAATTAAPYIINKHPVGRAVNMARGPAGRWLGAMLAKRAMKR